MKAWQRVLPAMIEWLSSGVHQQWRHPEEWQGKNELGEELFSQMGIWIESYVNQPLMRPYPEIQDVWLALAKQLRTELLALLAELEPTHSMALLCHLPIANERGYSWQRLAGRLHIGEEQLQEWEGQAYNALHEKVGEQTPFLHFLSQRLQELPGELTEEELAAQREKMLTEAEQNPSFDLRRFLSAQLELAIRQAYHRAGYEDVDVVKMLFAEEDRWLVELVGARIRLERHPGEGEEESDHG